MIIANLLTNMIVLGLHLGGLAGGIPTNTPTFQQYAFHAMLTNAQSISQAFKLDTNLIVSNKVTDFAANPTIHGIHGGITFANRYSFSYEHGKWARFLDMTYGELLTPLENDKPRIKLLKRTLAKPNLFNDATAKAFALNELHALGITPHASTFVNLVEQEQAALVDGNTEVLPFYTFTWQIPWTHEQIETLRASRQRARVPDAAREATNLAILLKNSRMDAADTFSMTVSGLTKKVVNISNTSRYFKLASPTNYLEILGLPTNTVFVVPKHPKLGEIQTYEVLELKP